jgi:hypothetical protein
MLPVIRQLTALAMERGCESRTRMNIGASLSTRFAFSSSKQISRARLKLYHVGNRASESHSDRPRFRPNPHNSNRDLHHESVAAHVLLAPVYRTRQRLGECLIRQQRSLETRRDFLRAFGRIHDGPAFHYDQRVSRRRCLNHHHAIGAHEICPPEAFHFDELCQFVLAFLMPP